MNEYDLEQLLQPKSADAQEVLLIIQDPTCFAHYLLRCLHVGVIPILTANHQPKFIEDMLTQGCHLITDEGIPEIGTHPHIYKVHTQWADAPLLPIDAIDGDGQVIFLTSGSTGQPKRIAKAFKHLLCEVDCLISNFGLGERPSDYAMMSHVSHDHLYGFIYNILMPIRLGIPIITKRYVHFPSLIAQLDPTKKNIITTSPVQLKHFYDEGLQPFPCHLCISSGAPLSAELGDILAEYGIPLVEIYGSTETGGISYTNRAQFHNRHHHPLPCVQLQTVDGQTYMRAAYVPNDDASPLGYPLDDNLAWHSDHSFSIIGRKDTIVKVAGKRVSLHELQTTLSRCPLLIEHHAWFDVGQEKLKAYIVLSKAGKNLYNSGVIQFRQALRQFILTYLIVEACPKIWYVVDEIPRNSQGKIDVK